MDIHNSIVEEIRTRTQRFHTNRTPFRIYHGSTNSTRHINFSQDAIIDVSILNNILSINPTTRTALVEPNVPMDTLVRETVKFGLLPPVVMEFPGITVGGGFVGTAGESSSFKHGFFDRCVLEAEVVLADGRVVKASENKERELFEGLRGSFGTLGVLTCVELKLMDVKRFVEVTYYPTPSIEGTMEKMQHETRLGDADYIDGILFSKTSGVIVTGRLTDSAHSSRVPIQRFSKPWNEWFWIHARSLSRKPNPTTELVLLEDYLFRYDRGAFWMGMYAFQLFMVPFLWLIRFLFDYFMHTRIMYHALHASGHTDRFIIQDIAFPAPNAMAFAEWVDSRFGIYPLWLCPLRKDARSSMGHSREWRGRDGTVYRGEYINIGVWGPYPSSEAEYVKANRELEAKIKELGGLKWLYARTFYTEDEWWDIYDKKKYDALRKRYNATSLPSVWDKVKHRGRKVDFESGIRGWLKRITNSNGLLSGFYGVYKALRGGDYMLKKKSN